MEGGENGKAGASAVSLVELEDSVKEAGNVTHLFQQIEAKLVKERERKKEPASRTLVVRCIP